ncbi:MAG TPA: hypothetical protein VFV33_26490, partial [Gemmatimonadaceae bacterium]|nr:hypothetical protein [Gemmatimonadaceae bacterium]
LSWGGTSVQRSCSDPSDTRAVVIAPSATWRLDRRIPGRMVVARFERRLVRMKRSVAGERVIGDPRFTKV